MKKKKNFFFFFVNKRFNFNIFMRAFKWNPDFYN